MGYAKNCQIEHDQKRANALDLAIDAGVLKSCPYHTGCTYLSENEIESAYKLADSKWSSGEISSFFETSREMIDLIKEVVEEHGDYYCNPCKELTDK